MFLYIMFPQAFTKCRLTFPSVWCSLSHLVCCTLHTLYTYSTHTLHILFFCLPKPCAEFPMWIIQTQFQKGALWLTLCSLFLKECGKFNIYKVQYKLCCIFQIVCVCVWSVPFICLCAWVLLYKEVVFFFLWNMNECKAPFSLLYV